METVARILVATDFSDESAHALAWGKELARRFGAEIVVLHVEEALAGAPSSDLVVERHRAAEQALERLVAQLRECGFAARGVLRAGTAFEEIVDAAHAEPVGLVVLGTHGRSGLAHLLMGSVAERVVRHAHCPVLTVRHREDGSTADKRRGSP